MSENNVIKYGCNDGRKDGNCEFFSNAEGTVLFSAVPSEYWFPWLHADGASKPTGHDNSKACHNIADNSGKVSIYEDHTTDGCYYFGKTTNPVKPCIGSSCVQCPTNKHSDEILRVTGDWTKDAGSDALWNPAEPKGLMTYDESICKYSLLITGLQPGQNYYWKVNLQIFLNLVD